MTVQKNIHPTVDSLRDQIVGLETPVPLLDGSSRAYINFDNGASTPALRGVVEKVDQLMETYASIHRGAGFKSLVSTRAYEQAHQIVLDFVGGDPRTDVVIFG